MVGASGFEPPTPRSRTECSTRLSHAPTQARTRIVAHFLRGLRPAARQRVLNRREACSRRRDLPPVRAQPLAVADLQHAKEDVATAEAFRGPAAAHENVDVPPCHTAIRHHVGRDARPRAPDTHDRTRRQDLWIRSHDPWMSSDSGLRLAIFTVRGRHERFRPMWYPALRRWTRHRCRRRCNDHHAAQHEAQPHALTVASGRTSRVRTCAEGRESVSAEPMSRAGSNRAPAIRGSEWRCDSSDPAAAA
jgi:hypothetical protein